MDNSWKPDDASPFPAFLNPRPAKPLTLGDSYREDIGGIDVSQVHESWWSRALIVRGRELGVLGKEEIDKLVRQLRSPDTVSWLRELGAYTSTDRIGAQLSHDEQPASGSEDRILLFLLVRQLLSTWTLHSEPEAILDGLVQALDHEGRYPAALEKRWYGSRIAPNLQGKLKELVEHEAALFSAPAERRFREDGLP